MKKECEDARKEPRWEKGKDESEALFVASCSREKSGAAGGDHKTEGETLRKKALEKASPLCGRGRRRRFSYPRCSPPRSMCPKGKEMSMEAPSRMRRKAKLSD